MRSDAQHIQKLIHEANKILSKKDYDKTSKNALFGCLKSVSHSEYLTAKDRRAIGNLFCR